jgi:hypothetical protein
MAGERFCDLYVGLSEGLRRKRSEGKSNEQRGEGLAVNSHGCFLDNKKGDGGRVRTRPKTLIAISDCGST